MNFHASLSALYGASIPVPFDCQLLSSRTGILDYFRGHPVANTTELISLAINGYRGIVGETIVVQCSATSQTVTIQANVGNFSASSTNGSQRIIASSKFHGEYTNTATPTITTGTWTTFKYITIKNDDASIYSPATGIGTLNRNGLLKLSAACQYADAATFTNQLRIKIVDPIYGTSYVAGIYSYSVGYPAASISATVKLNMGATFELQTYHSKGSNSALGNDGAYDWLTFDLE
jgi:hypothetical protein